MDLLSEVWESGGWEEAEPDRVLATVLFTDIVGSSERAASLGDRAWRELLERHHEFPLPPSPNATLNVRGSSCDPARRRRSSNRLRGADLLAVGTRGDHRVEGVAGEDDPLAPRGYRGSQCRSARARSGRAGRPVRAPEFRRESSRRSACRPHHPALEPVQIGSRSGRREAPGVVRR